METDGQVVVADLEAGIGTLTRLGETPVDAVLVIAEPTQKSIEVARRAVALVDERALGHVIVIANRLEDDDDHEMVRAAFPNRDVVGVPYDKAIEEADRQGRSVLDVAPDSPATQVIATLAARLSQTPQRSAQ